ncbi:Uncharacterised protein [Nocardia africana]|uniref:DUF4192 domain-containing protein n=1 Tax=Nocardia africana TaxID=134964 RepID=A0A378X0H3_9NOCA|nr:Uncharacterised protein [Nocardia africana]
MHADAASAQAHTIRVATGPGTPALPESTVREGVPGRESTSATAGDPRKVGQAAEDAEDAETEATTADECGTASPPSSRYIAGCANRVCRSRVGIVRTAGGTGAAGTEPFSLRCGTIHSSTGAGLPRDSCAGARCAAVREGVGAEYGCDGDSITPQRRMHCAAGRVIRPRANIRGNDSGDEEYAAPHTADDVVDPGSETAKPIPPQDDTSPRPATSVKNAASTGPDSTLPGAGDGFGGDDEAGSSGPGDDGMSGDRADDVEERGIRDARAGQRWAATALTMSEPAEFIAAVPALLGFRPQRSLVACLLLRSQKYPGAVYLGAVARHDLDVAGCGAWMRLAGQLAAICGQEQAVGVVTLIVDDRATAPRAGRAGRRAARHRDLVRVLDGALQSQDVLLAEVWAVAEIAPGAEWWSVLDPDTAGTQADPAASPVALAQVLDGRPIRGSRDELTVAVAEDTRLGMAVDAAIDSAAEAARLRFRRALRAGEPRSYSRAALDMVLWQISTVESGDDLDPRELADLAVAVRDTAVRDSLFAVALGEHAAAAEALWSRACRGLTGPDRAELATLFGYSAYTRGDGPLAGVAFEAALQADPAHRIARLLDAALRTGMRPGDVRKLAVSGRDIAAGLGVDLVIADPGEPPTEAESR